VQSQNNLEQNGLLDRLTRIAATTAITTAPLSVKEAYVISRSVKKESNRISMKLYREDYTRLLKRGSVGDILCCQAVVSVSVVLLHL